MQARGVLADVVTCCSLINALERGGQWQLAEQLFVQMCAASWQTQGVNSPLYRIMEIAAAPSPETSEWSNAPQSASWHDDSGDRSLQQHRLSGDLSVLQPAGAKLLSDMQQASSPYRLGQDQFMPQASSPYRMSQDQSQSRSDSTGGTLSSLITSANRQLRDDYNGSGRILRSDSQSARQADFPQGFLTADSPNSSVTQTPPSKRLEGNQQDSNSSASSISMSYNTSDYVPKYSPSYDLNAMGLNSPARPSHLTHSESMPKQSGDSASALLESFSNMRVGNTPSAVQRALFPPEQTELNNGPSTSNPLQRASSDVINESAVRQIQRAAVSRQEMLSLRPMTNPAGGSLGQAPVLRHMNVSQIAPNRVCCNALLAAYARAKPTLWQKVTLP